MRVIKTCRCCGRERPDHGRGLCSQCYFRARRNGTLDDWSARAWKPRADVVEDVEHLLAARESPARIASRLGYANVENLRRVMYRANRLDLVDKLGPDSHVARQTRRAVRIRREEAA